MDNKPKSDLPNSANASGGEPRAPDTKSSSQIRKEVDRATGKVADAAKDGLNKAMSELHPGRLIWQTLTGHRFSAR